MRRLLHNILALSVLLLIASAEARADKLDEFIREQMRKRQLPGLSLVIIQDGKIVKVKGYGVTEKGGKIPVTPSTLFQAGSISKPVAAVGVLRLVDRGRLSLDEDVNTKLTTWKVPENEHTKEKKVTLRGLLSHTAGLTVHGFPGYEVGGPVPPLVQILDGEKPTNTLAIRVDVVPGSRGRYSGGGYTVMQQLVLDVTGSAYPLYMREAVLELLGMNDSTYEQPLPSAKAKVTATGHYQDRSLVKGRWHIYPEMAAAGLWATPSDLARFAIGVQHAYAGKPGAILSRQMTLEMLTKLKNNYGLGVGLDGEGRTLRFAHGGRDEGFDAMMMAYAETGQGAVIMINANDNSRMVSRILSLIASEYSWPDYPTSVPTKRPVANVDAKTLDAYAGRYEFANNRMLTIAAGKGRLFTHEGGFEDEEFVPESVTSFLSAERDAQITYTKNASGEVTGFVWKRGTEEKRVPRIGPLARSIKPQPDPNPILSRAIEAALRAFAEGGKSVEEVPGVTPGARKQFGRGTPALAGIKSLSFVAEYDLQQQGIERHEGKVGRVLYYKLVTDKAVRYVLVHLTADGLVTDYDVVDD
ncbi:MAG: serine hydrolase [Acidobacteriota bacterium]|nr:serine hydrolase [Acidobacteriota bacterium]